MRIHLNRSVASYRKLVESETFGGDVSLSLARVLLSMIEDPGSWHIDDRGGWVEIVRDDDDELDRLRALVEALDI